MGPTFQQEFRYLMWEGRRPDKPSPAPSEAGGTAEPCQIRLCPQYFQQGFWELLQTVTNFETYPFLPKIPLL